MKTNKQKKVLAINDISCVGRCSLTVSLPIISAAGIECSILPTAILSTHTGGFQGFTFKNCSDDIIPISQHWKSLGLNFDTIYTGFLGSIDQIDLVAKVIDDFKTEDNLVVVDPTMADNGVLYSIFDMNFASNMKKLCLKADVVIPNITEACLLTGVEYQEKGHTKEYLMKIFQSFKDMGIKYIVLTGASLNDNEIGAATFNANTNEMTYYSRKTIPGYYHGTGDVFGSVLVSAITKNKSLNESAKLAVDYTVESILTTIKYDNIDLKYGVNFEEVIPLIVNELNK